MGAKIRKGIREDKDIQTVLELFLQTARKRNQLRELLSFQWDHTGENIFHSVCPYPHNLMYARGSYTIERFKLIIEAALHVAPSEAQEIHDASGLPLAISGVIASFLRPPCLTKLVNQRSNRSETPLWRVCARDSKYPEAIDIARLLVAAGADPSVPAITGSDHVELTALNSVQRDLLKEWTWTTPQEKEQMEKMAAYLETVMNEKSK